MGNYQCFAVVVYKPSVQIVLITHIYICRQLCSKSNIHSDKVRDIIDGQKEVDTAIDFLHTTSKLSHSSKITSGWFSAV